MANIQSFVFRGGLGVGTLSVMSRWRASWFFILASCAVTAGGCSGMPIAEMVDADLAGDGGVTPSSTNPDLAQGATTGAPHYQADIQPIWEQYCKKCHIDGPRTPQLAKAISYESLV